MKDLHCISFRQILMLLFVLVISDQHSNFSNVGDQAGVQPFKKSSKGRFPASYIPRDDVQAVPEFSESWTHKIFLRDNAGVLENVRVTFASWRAREDYARLWNLKSTGNYEVPDAQFRQAFFQRQLLRYLDKRVTGGIKNASGGSALHQIAQVQEALRPQTEASISKNIKLKFKARVLRGRIDMRVENPWVDYSTEFTLTGNVNMWIKKKIDWADTTASVNYQPKEGSYLAELDKPVSDHVIARLSVRQPATSSSIDNTLQLLYNKGF